MGKLVNGVWRDDWYDTKSTNGKFERKDSSFRNWITPDGLAGASGKGGFVAEAERYHLYVSNACPWAHRTMIFRAIKGLEDIITTSVVDPLMAERGWAFSDCGGGSYDTVNNKRYLHETYTLADPKYSGRVTVPVLWDKRQNTIVSNESAEIIRMFNSAFDGLPGVLSDIDFYPEHLQTAINDINERIYHAVNNGVYKAGFATTQSAYDDAVTTLFEALDWLEAHLSSRRYLTGDRITEADWRLFTTLIRFDPVYVGHFKCNVHQLVDYANLWSYTRELYQMPGVAGTVHMTHIKDHYYRSHTTINRTAIVPMGLTLDYAEPHGREDLSV